LYHAHHKHKFLEPVRPHQLASKPVVTFLEDPLLPCNFPSSAGKRKYYYGLGLAVRDYYICSREKKLSNEFEFNLKR